MQTQPKVQRVWFYLNAEQVTTIKELAAETGWRQESAVARKVVAAGLEALGLA